MAPETVPAFPWMPARSPDKKSMHGQDSNQNRGLLTVRCQVPTQPNKSQNLSCSQLGDLKWRVSAQVFPRNGRCSYSCTLWVNSGQNSIHELTQVPNCQHFRTSAARLGITSIPFCLLVVDPIGKQLANGMEADAIRICSQIAELIKMDYLGKA